MAMSFSSSTTVKLFITCSPGVEPLLANEVKQIINIEPEIASGGVSLMVPSFEEIMKLNLYLRTASRVLMQLFDAPCRYPQDVYKAFRKRHWLGYFPHLESFMIDAPLVHHRGFTNSLYAAQIAKDGLCDSLKSILDQRPSVDTKNPQIRFVITILDDVLEVFLDTSLDSLHKRGIRMKGNEAPIRETLAAALLLTVGLKEDDIICDPCCGSGTILLEAALIQSNTPPGILRNKWGFLKHPKCDHKMWTRIQDEAKKAIRPLKPESFIAIDSDRDSVDLLREALRKLKLEEAFVVRAQNFQDAELPTPPTLFVTNPPYGVRLQEGEDLRPLYRSLGEFMKQKGAHPSRGAVFTSYDMSKEIGLKATKRHVFKNGQIDCRLLEYDLY